MKLPELGEGILEAELVDWLVEPNDEVSVGQSIAEVLTDKAAIALPSPFTGRVQQLMAEPGQSIAVGAPILKYADSAGGEQASDKAAVAVDAAKRATQPVSPTSGNGSSASSTVATSKPGASPKAAPSVRRRARELGIDLNTVSGSGPGGRVLMADLQAPIEQPTASESETSGAPFRGSSSERSTGSLTPGSTIPLRGLRRKIAEHMVRSKTEIPHYSLMDECDVTDLVRLRARLKPELAEQGIRLTYLAFIVKATAEALKEFPLINASLDADAEEIRLHSHYNIGIAVATPNGLIVPVVKNADQLSLGQVAESIQRLSEQAREGTIALADLRGATFVVTSIGGIGGLISTPIINQPNVGIMGVGRVVRRPIFDDLGQVQPADMMYLSYSFDHRVIDGAIGAEFNNAIMRRLGDPVTWLIPT